MLLVYTFLCCTGIFALIARECACDRREDIGKHSINVVYAVVVSNTFVIFSFACVTPFIIHYYHALQVDHYDVSSAVSPSRACLTREQKVAAGLYVQIWFSIRG